MAKKPNYMTVPAAIRELEKKEMVRGLDGVYRFDHAITATYAIYLLTIRCGDSILLYKKRFLLYSKKYYSKDSQTCYRVCNYVVW